MKRWLFVPGPFRDKLNHHYCKYWWVLMLLRERFSVLFLDNDNVVLRNPFHHWQPARYHLEGLSDWVKEGTRHLPSPMVRALPVAGQQHVTGVIPCQSPLLG